MSSSYYDVLDVSSDASPEEIRAAWRSAVADLDPTDRRFAVYNEAGGVLLDPERRAAYDAELTGGGAGTRGEADPPPVADRPAPTAAPVATAPARTRAPAAQSSAGLTRGERRAARQSAKKLHRDARTRAAGPQAPRRAGGGVPTWALAALGLLLVALVTASIVLAVTVPADDTVDEATSEAQSAAERAIVPVLSYDYRSLDADGEAARDWLTDDYYADSYEPLFAQIKESAPQTKTVVRTEVVASGLVRGGEDRVQVLIFVDRPTRNKQLEEPVVYKDQVRVTMAKVGDRWLVDELCTTASCEA